MTDFNLVTVCITAFSSVFLLLAFLAAVMRLITTVFPGKEKPKVISKIVPSPTGTIDAVMAAAITRTVNIVYPGTKVLHIEEIK